MSNLPEQLYYVEFINNKFKNEPAIQFDNYDEAYKYAQKIDSTLLNTEIIEYKPTKNFLTLSYYTKIINKLLEKMECSKRVLLQDVKYTSYCSTNEFHEAIFEDSFIATVYLFNNIMLELRGHIEVKDINITPLAFLRRYKNQNIIMSYIEDKKSGGYPLKYEQSNTVITTHDPRTNNVYTPKILNARINMRIYLNNEESISERNFYIINNVDSFKLFFKLITYFDKHDKEASISTLNTQELFKKVALTPKYSKNINNATEFLESFLFDKNV